MPTQIDCRDVVTPPALPYYIYVDVNAARHLSIAFSEEPLPRFLRRQIAICPVTIMEFLSQLVTPPAETLRCIRGFRYWTDVEGFGRILPWADHEIAWWGFKTRMESKLGQQISIIGTALSSVERLDSIPDLLEWAVAYRNRIDQYKDRQSELFQGISCEFKGRDKFQKNINWLEVMWCTGLAERAGKA